MHIELIETLRCVAPHEETWLVGAFDRVVDRDIREGRLGCPVCGATYPIERGVVSFAPASPATAPAAAATTPTAHAPSADAPTADAPTADAALRLAAMLDLASPGGLVVLEGAWGDAGAMLANFIETRLLLLNAPHGPADDGLSRIRAPRSVPVAAGSCRGIAVHRGAAAEVLAQAAVPALRAGGRLVAPAHIPLPADVRELARDDAWWVAERPAPPPSLVRLGRR